MSEQNIFHTILENIHKIKFEWEKFSINFIGEKNFIYILINGKFYWKFEYFGF
jgi:hypothetical protein